MENMYLLGKKNMNEWKKKKKKKKYKMTMCKKGVESIKNLFAMLIWFFYLNKAIFQTTMILDI